MSTPKDREGLQCPDCSAVVVNNAMTHEDTCPVALGLDAAGSADRDWFLAHPNADEYHRPVTWAEREEQRWFCGAAVEAFTHVHVVQIEPGIRERRLYARRPKTPMSGYLVRREGPFDKAVLHALRSIWEDLPVGLACDACERVFADKLSQIAAVVPMGQGRPATVIVHLCPECRADLVSQSEEVLS